MKPIIFFTPPTSKIARNVENVIFNLWYLINRSSGIPRCYYAKRVLIDSGINAIFEGMKLKEYPKRYLENYHIYARRVARKIRRKNPNCEIWVVIPDYPADLPDNILENNVERTIENWLKFKDKGDKSFVWMPSIQAKRMDFESFVYSYFSPLGIYSPIAFPNFFFSRSFGYSKQTLSTTLSISSSSIVL
jgi:hypothetical protein